MKKETINKMFVLAGIRSAAFDLQTIKKNMSIKEIENQIKEAEKKLASAKLYLNDGGF